jgi:serine/threonine protein kinase
MAHLYTSKLIFIYTNNSSQIFDEQTIIPIMRGVASAVSYLHERDCVHMDIKPSNLILVNNQIKLIDLVSVAHERALEQDVHYTRKFVPPGK